jgi:hypothetical protein
LQRLLHSPVHGDLHQRKVDIAGRYIANKVGYDADEKGKDDHGEQI